MKVVLIRLDKIGDLVSTLPVDQEPFLKDMDVHWLIGKGLGFVPTHALPQRKFLELDKADAKSSFRKLLQFLKEQKPDIAVSFQAPWWISLALWLTKVPTRAGVKSQWHSFLFLNKTLRQKRSLARQHEADYNADLLAYAFDQLEKRQQEQKTTHRRYQSPILELQAPSNFPLLQKHSLIRGQYFVVHPGMAGSALNWSVKNYLDLIRHLVIKSVVVITGTPADEPWLTEIKKHYSAHPHVRILQNQLSTPELLSLLAEARAVLAPSTGVAHLAASLGTPVVCLFSPIQVQRPQRWAPRGDLVQIFEPQVNCPAQFKCLGPSCAQYYCLDQIKVSTIAHNLESIEVRQP